MAYSMSYTQNKFTPTIEPPIGEECMVKTILPGDRGEKEVSGKFFMAQEMNGSFKKYYVIHKPNIPFGSVRVIREKNAD